MHGKSWKSRRSGAARRRQWCLRGEMRRRGTTLQIDMPRLADSSKSTSAADCFDSFAIYRSLNDIRQPYQTTGKAFSGSRALQIIWLMTALARSANDLRWLASGVTGEKCGVMQPCKVYHVAIALRMALNAVSTDVQIHFQATVRTISVLASD